MGQRPGLESIWHHSELCSVRFGVIQGRMEAMEDKTGWKTEAAGHAQCLELQQVPGGQGSVTVRWGGVERADSSLRVSLPPFRKNTGGLDKR